MAAFDLSPRLAAAFGHLLHGAVELVVAHAGPGRLGYGPGGHLQALQAGAGGGIVVTAVDTLQVLAQFEQMKSMMKGIGKMAAGGKGFKMPPGMGGMGGFGRGRRGFFK